MAFESASQFVKYRMALVQPDELVRQWKSLDRSLLARTVEDELRRLYLMQQIMRELVSRGCENRILEDECGTRPPMVDNG